MFNKYRNVIIVLLSLFVLVGCDLEDIISEGLQDENGNNEVSESITISDLANTTNFRDGAVEHILEGELNRKGQAVGFHYDGLQSKKGSVIEGTETDPNEFGVYEAKVEVDGVEKTSNGGRSTFFPIEWTAQEVIDSINDAYSVKEFKSGNTYEGLTSEGQVIRMYLDQNELIISAFPVY